MRRKSEGALVPNERQILMALHCLRGEQWSRPLLDEVDRSRDDGKRTGPGTLLRAMALFESRGWVVTNERGGRRYYRLTRSGTALARAIAREEATKEAFERAAALVGRLSGAIPSP